MEQNTQIIIDFYDFLKNGAYDKAFGLLHPEFELIQAETLPYGGVYKGKEGVQFFFKKLFDYFETFGSEEVTYFSNEDKVVATSIAVGLTKQKEAFRMPMVQVYTLESGKILRTVPFYYDTGKFKK
ncbi:MAG: nuclear transport factor 2 family protein [Bacteroidota bacterium]